MNIHEMHNGFRTLGQKMGIQLIRGILPESIDVFLNDAIIEKTKEELLNGVNTSLKDNVNLQVSTMNPINLFRNLYRNARYKIDDATNNKLVQHYNSNNGYYEIIIPTIKYQSDSEISLPDGEYFINPMMYLGFSIEYDDNSKGNATICRIISSDIIEATLQDYCNSADKKNPIITLIGNPKLNYSLESLKNSGNEYVALYTSTKNCEVKYLNIKYIKTPNIVKYSLNPDECVNCDLPEYVHYEIVEKAVQKYFISIKSDV